MKFHHFWPPCKIFMGYLWKDPLMPPLLEKKSFRCPCVRARVRALLISCTVSKVSDTKKDDMFFNGFSSVTRALTSMSSCTLRYQNARTRQSISSKLSAKMPTVLRMQWKTKTQLKFICHICPFAYKIKQISLFRRVLKPLKLHQIEPISR